MCKVEYYRAISYDLYLTIACLYKISIVWWLVVVYLVRVISNMIRCPRIEYERVTQRVVRSA